MTASLTPLLFSHSHHLLAVKGCDAALDVLAFEGQETLSRPFRYRIEFTSPDHDITKENMLLKPASLTLRAPVDQGFGIAAQRPLRVIQGVVSGFERLGSSKDETRYALTLEPRLALLARSHQNAIYQDMSVPQIVEKVLRERHGMRGQDFLFSLTKSYPRREQVMQYGEDDLHFVSRLLGEVGIWFRFTTDTRLNIDVAEFCDDRQGYVRGLSLPAVAPSGMADQGAESVWGLTARHRVVEQEVSVGEYNYRQAMQEMGARAELAPEAGGKYGEAYHWGDHYLTAGGEPGQAESGAFYARLRHERYLNGQTRLSGLSNSATLWPGRVLEVTGAEAAEFGRGVVVTEVRSRARRDRSFEAEFAGIPDSVEYGFRPQPGRRPVMAGTLPARVTSTTENDLYGHIDKEGRYRVNMLFDRAEWERGFESLWVRQSRPYAGDTYGLHLPLLAGTEVAIGFEDGNPDRPYIAGVLHDSAHPDLVTIKNYRRNVLRTPANNKIRLEDARGSEHIKVSTEYGGKSQLNLGHLVDGERQRRGEGFELRSDAWGAIRAQKGLFITADGQEKAQGEVLEMAPALGNLRRAREEMQAISVDAGRAGAKAAELEAQVRLLEEKVTALKEAVMLLSAPAGMALSSGSHLQLSAGESLTATAGKNADVSVVKNLFIGVGNALSVFVRKLGIKLIANQGPVEVQAQNDTMALMARHGLTISSTEDEIKITAKKKITLNGGGSYITLDENKIESATPGDYLTKAGYYGRLERASAEQAFQAFPVLGDDSGPQSLRFALSQDAVNKPYIIHNSAGEIVSQGTIGEDGRTPRVKLEESDELILTLGKTEWIVSPIAFSESAPESITETNFIDDSAVHDPYTEQLAEEINDFLPAELIAKIVGPVEGEV